MSVVTLLVITVLGGMMVDMASCASSSSSQLNLTEQIMNISHHAAILSAVTYNMSADATIQSDYDTYQRYLDEPDSALFVKTFDGYCFGVFRGTTPTGADWSQNIDPFSQQVCSLQGDCCRTRRGFWNAYYGPTYQSTFETDLRACAANCSNPMECVVLTGHSQGGAVALLASVALKDLNPYTITFGQPGAVHACALIKSERVYRYINTVVDREQIFGNPDLEYDVVPFAPYFGTTDFGHLIVLPPTIMEEDSATSVVYYGKDDSPTTLLSKNLAVGAHDIGRGTHTYRAKIEALRDRGLFPVPADGFPNGSVCIQDDNCKSNRCYDLECWEPEDACADCSDDSDCRSKHCLGGICTAVDTGKIPDGCSCNWDSDCESGRCEGSASDAFTTFVCEPLGNVGDPCDADDDCTSNRCSWWSWTCLTPSNFAEGN